MSLYLAIDTATAIGSVALGSPHTLIGEVTIGARRQAAALLPAAQDLMSGASVRVSDLAGIVLADGPGSFTGLRIGFATAKGLLRECPELELRLVPSLMACAWGGARFADGIVAALYDALRGEVFAAAYAFDDERVRTILPPTLTTLAGLRVGKTRPTLALGDGALLYAGDVREWTGRAPVGPPWGTPRAAALLELLGVEGATDVVAAPFDVEPAYGRAPAAQTRWEERHGAPLTDPGSHAR